LKTKKIVSKKEVRFLCTASEYGLHNLYICTCLWKWEHGNEISQRRYILMIYQSHLTIHLL